MPDGYASVNVALALLHLRKAINYTQIIDYHLENINTVIVRVSNVKSEIFTFK